MQPNLRSDSKVLYRLQSVLPLTENTSKQTAYLLMLIF